MAGCDRRSRSGGSRCARVRARSEAVRRSPSSARAVRRPRAPASSIGAFRNGRLAAGRDFRIRSDRRRWRRSAPRASASPGPHRVTGPSGRSAIRRTPSTRAASSTTIPAAFDVILAPRLDAIATHPSRPGCPSVPAGGVNRSVRCGRRRQGGPRVHPVGRAGARRRATQASSCTPGSCSRAARRGSAPTVLRRDCGSWLEEAIRQIAFRGAGSARRAGAGRASTRARASTGWSCAAARRQPGGARTRDPHVVRFESRRCAARRRRGGAARGREESSRTRGARAGAAATCRSARNRPRAGASCCAFSTRDRAGVTFPRGMTFSAASASPRWACSATSACAA